MGRKQVSQMTFFDYVVGITIGSIIAAASVDKNISLYDGIISTIVWTIAPILIGWINLKSLFIRRITNGGPLIIIENGKINLKNMARSRYNMDNLLMQLREKDIFNLEEVQTAILETDGVLTVSKKSAYNNPTIEDLKIIPPNDEIMISIIIDGVIIDKNLKKYGKNKKWLDKQLDFKKINDITKVVYGGLTKTGYLHIVEKP